MNSPENDEGKTIAVSFAVVTYERGDGVFDKFLEALYTVVSAPIKPREITVINNDDVAFESVLELKLAQAHKTWVSRAAKDSLSVEHWPELIVRTSPEKNLSVARNLAIDTAASPLLVFIDDDQQVESNWIEELVSCMERYKADVVAGPVYCDYPSTAPLWLQKTDIHNTKGHATGDRLYGITAGNSLIRLASIGKLRFNPQYGRTGGEDTDFFKRLHDSGRDIRWCSEAASAEWITADRAKASYAIRRFIDQGQTYRRMTLSNAGALKTLVFYLRAAFQAVVALPIAVVFILLRRPTAGDWVKRCGNNLGKLVHRASSDYS